MVDTILCYHLADKGTSISSHGPIYHAIVIEEEAPAQFLLTLRMDQTILKALSQ